MSDITACAHRRLTRLTEAGVRPEQWKCDTCPLLITNAYGIGPISERRAMFEDFASQFVPRSDRVTLAPTPAAPAVSETATSEEMLGTVKRVVEAMRGGKLPPEANRILYANLWELYADGSPRPAASSVAPADRTGAVTEEDVARAIPIWRKAPSSHAGLRAVLEDFLARRSSDTPPQGAERVTRFEVIDHRSPNPRDEDRGRVYVAKPCCIELLRQDEGQTLKVFVTDRPASAEGQR